MKKTLLYLGSVLLLSTFIFSSCSKSSSNNENNSISVPPLQIGQAITSSTLGAVGQTLIPSYNGTLLTTVGTYHVVADIIVPKGDTLYIQPGVTVCVSQGAAIIVKGVLISMGTAQNPNYFTNCSLSKINTVAEGQSAATDPAYNPTGTGASWVGIQGDTTCTLICLKWTHVDFTGASNTALAAGAYNGGSTTKTHYAILFQNPNADLIVEDSWFYGSADDCIRINAGRFSIMRSTFEKCGGTTGDVINVKSGGVGDAAYNLIVGGATNGTKASNKGELPNTVECNFNMYNNTYINCGFRNTATGKGGSLNYEQSAEGMAYNNLIVNCHIGLRMNNSPAPDTANIYYGNNFAYADSLTEANQFYPVGYLTKDFAYIVPPQHQVDSLGFVYSGNGTSAYNGQYFVGKNNPNFVNFNLPESGYGINALGNIAYVGNFNFRLAANSPCIGRGYTSFSALKATKVTKSPFAAIVTQPGVDIGAYQYNGTGNQH